MRRLVNLAAGAGLAVALTGGFGAAPASALAPSQAGWWTTANAGSSVPGSSPANPPDVPADGLLIEGGASSSSGASDSGATAFAAVVYDVLPGATVGNLTLKVAPQSATTPGATLEICPLSTPTIQNEHGGPMSDAPSYSCKQHVTAGPSSSGTTYTFKVAGLVSNSTLAVAILPTSVVDRVVFSAPGADALEVTGGATTPVDPTASGSSVVSSGSTTGAPTAASPSAAGSSLAGSSGSSVATGSPTSSGASGGPVSAAAPISGAASSAPSAGTSPALATQTQSSGGSTSSTTTAQQGSASSPVDSQFAASTSGSSKANPLAVGLLIAAVLIGGAIWLAVGRAASSAAGDTGAEPTPS